MMYRCEQCASDGKCIGAGTCIEACAIAVPSPGIWAAWGECFTTSRTVRDRQDMNLLRSSLLPKNNAFQNLRPLD